MEVDGNWKKKHKMCPAHPAHENTRLIWKDIIYTLNVQGANRMKKQFKISAALWRQDLKNNKDHNQ